jgi:hypothetical protein
MDNNVGKIKKYSVHQLFKGEMKISKVTFKAVI